MPPVQAKRACFRARSSIGHALLSAITVGTGGSTGREGPIGYVGATLAPASGENRLHAARPSRSSSAAGFSAGIAASFQLPRWVRSSWRGTHRPPNSPRTPSSPSSLHGDRRHPSPTSLEGHATFAVAGFPSSLRMGLLLYIALGDPLRRSPPSASSAYHVDVPCLVQVGHPGMDEAGPWAASW